MKFSRARQRQHRMFEFPQFAGDEFPFDFQADHKNEYGHQPVVDP
jgi:hypothetical protein